MWKENLSRYKGVFIAMTFFAAFFILYLAINFSLQGLTLGASNYAAFTSQVKYQTVALDDGDIFGSQELLMELSRFRLGGEVIFVDGSEFFLTPVTEYFDTNVPNIPAIESNLRDGNLEVARQGVIALERAAYTELANKTHFLNVLQIAVAIFTFVIYLMTTMLLLRQLSQSDSIGVTTKEETSDILSTVSEGLFLLGRDHDIGVQQSDSLKGMFMQERDIEGNFFDFISQYITQGDLKIAKDYLELLFGDRVKEKLVESLNPLNEVEIAIARRDGSFENRYLNFKFKRVLKGEKLGYLLGSVSDITKQVLLERELEGVKEEQEAQIELLKKILHIDNDQLKAFFSSVENELNGINERLQEQSVKLGDHEIRSMLKGISQDVHKIKGDSAALGLHQFEFSAHDFETAIEEVEQEKGLSGRALLPLTTHLRNMLKELDMMKTLVEKFADSLPQSINKPTTEEGMVDTAPAAEENSQPVSAFSEKIQNIVNTVSDRNKVPARLELIVDNESRIPTDISNDLSSIAIQLTRNAIAHGAQDPEQRLAAEKPEELSVQIKLDKTDRGYELVVRDDGMGIDPKSIIQRAHKIGLAEASEMENTKITDCYRYLFHPSFSSADGVSLDAGRGAGLPLVGKVLKKHRGKISISSQAGEYCQFRVLLPAA